MAAAAGVGAAADAEAAEAAAGAGDVAPDAAAEDAAGAEDPAEADAAAEPDAGGVALPLASTPEEAAVGPVDAASTPVSVGAADAVTATGACG